MDLLQVEKLLKDLMIDVMKLHWAYSKNWGLRQNVIM